MTLPAIQENATRYYNEDQWVEHFKPRLNPTSDEGFDLGTGPILFSSTYPDFAAVQEEINAGRDTVWTLTECDGEMAISAGFHRVNAMGYFITELPCVTESGEWVPDVILDDWEV